MGSKLKNGKGLLKPNFEPGPNRAERERGMRRFKSVGQPQRFVTAYTPVQNLFNLGRHLVRAKHYRNLRVIAFSERSSAAA